MKRCASCRRRLPREAFYANPKCSDGLYSYCRSCKSKMKKAYYAKPGVKDKIVALNRKWRAANPKRYRETSRRWYHTPKGNQTCKRGYERWRKSRRGKESIRGWRIKNAEKCLAYALVRAALASGLLVKPKRCQGCGKAKRLGSHHHKGYSKEHRLDVRWLCSLCHGVASRKP